jgi:uncharacterized protein YndB with AHSA1/START domain
MISVEKTVHINKSIAEVFAYVTNYDYVTKWQGGVEAVEPGGENAVGGKYTEVRKFLGREMKTTLEITEFEQNAKWAAKALTGPVPYEAATTFESANGGTKLTTRVEAEPSGFFKMAQGAVQSQLDKSLDEDLNRLKEILEA